MIKVVINKATDGSIEAFTVSGHSGYAQSGQDIICSAVSALSQTTICALQELTDLTVTYRMNEEQAYIHCSIKPKDHQNPDIEDRNSIVASALLQMFEIGCRKIKESYGERYITVENSRIDK